MTIGGDYISGDGRNFESSANYPVVFGLKLTPTVSGILLALLGLGGAAWLLLNLVQPTWQQTEALTRDIQDKEAQVLASEETRQRIQEARVQLQEAQQLRADVLTLFATEESMDTLLLDLNERVQSANAGITDPDRRATLSKFTLNDKSSGVISDSSFGAAVNGKLERQVFDVQMQGSFAQTQSIIRSIERLQPLLVVRNFKSELDRSTQEVVVDEQGRLVPNGQPLTRITTGFQLDALIPVEAPAPAPAGATPAAGAPAASPSP